jgi:uncharacterized protein (DUF2235 family)
VFDTVASVGMLIPKTLPFVVKNGSIGIFRHAMGLDERRYRFMVEPYFVEGEGTE